METHSTVCRVQMIDLLYLIIYNSRIVDFLLCEALAQLSMQLVVFVANS